ncbi:hypothetical protein HPB50_027919 [Hyalomma asiaticum]|nr:hypothetical protein HPB50_027919 [Hyalomma asiaticum]
MPSKNERQRRSAIGLGERAVVKGAHGCPFIFRAAGSPGISANACEISIELRRSCAEDHGSRRSLGHISPGAAARTERSTTEDVNRSRGKKPLVVLRFTIED